MQSCCHTVPHCHAHSRFVATPQGEALGFAVYMGQRAMVGS